MFTRSRAAMLIECAEHQDQRTRAAREIVGLRLLRAADAETITDLRGQLRWTQAHIRELQEHGRAAEELLAVVSPSTTEDDQP
jgi:hypothetical protein